MRSLKKLAICATTWLVIGLLGGVFSREFTKAHDVTAWTQLKVVHTHSLALGFMLTLIVLLLERAFTLSQHHGAFATYFWGFNLGLLLTIAMLVMHGVMQVNGHTEASPAMSGIAGLGHIGLSVGLVGLMVALFKSLPTGKNRDQLTTDR